MGGDIAGIHGPMQQQHLDQCPGPDSIIVGFPGRSAERFMG